MAVLHTEKIHICALKKNRKQILEELQRTGRIQIEADTDEDEIFRHMDTASASSAFEKRAANAEEALKILETYAPEKTGMLSALEGKKAISLKEYEKGVEIREQTLKDISALLAYRKNIGEARAARVRAESALESLSPWMSLDIPMNSTGTKTTAVFIGSLQGRWTEETLTPALAAVRPDLKAYSLEILGSDRDQTCIFAVTDKSSAPALEDALRVSGFVRPAVSCSTTPAEYAEVLKAQAADAVEDERQAQEDIRALAERRPALRFAADYYRMRAEKYRVLGGILQSGHVFFINGFVPEGEGEKLKERLERKYTCQVEIEAVSDDEEAPVLLRNNSFAEPTESVVEAFGLPKKGEIDPTAVMAFFYYFLFGLMLSDAGYGILMVILCFVAVKKFPDMEKGLQKMLRMFFFCGISTIFWGVMFGSYFGDVIPVVAETFFHREVTVPALWFAPLDDPMKLLMFSFLFGIIHLFVGLGAKGYMLARDHDWMGLFSGVICWYALLVGLILLLLPSDMFASMAGVVIVLPSWVGAAAKWVSIVSAVCIVVLSESGTKNIAARLALGAYDLYGVSGWLSDVLSYSRLLALGLATGVIGTVINTMGSMLGGSVIGFILFWVIFIVGHILNMAINLLGAYVHTNRLQFVEFFGKFYEGGGRPFRPFSAESNKYFKFKEEE